MPIKISTSKNHLGTSKKPFTVRTESSVRVEFEELVSIMAAGRTTITAPDIAGTFLLQKQELAKLVADGKYVKTPFGSFYLSTCGLRLRFDEVDQNQGVFFINGTEHRSPGYAYLDNRTVVAQVPENIEPGPYEVYIRCINHSKELKQGKAERALTVSLPPCHELWAASSWRRPCTANKHMIHHQ